MTPRRILSIQLIQNYDVPNEGRASRVLGQSMMPVHPYFDLLPGLITTGLAPMVTDDLEMRWGWFADPVTVFLMGFKEQRRDMHKALLEQLEKWDEEDPDSPAVVSPVGEVAQPVG